MTAKHTKGPLDVRPVTGYGACFQVVESATKLLVAEAHGSTAEEAEANARLYAAAPELLDVLQWVVESWPLDNEHYYRADHEDAVKRARDLVQKARGQQ